MGNTILIIVAGSILLFGIANVSTYKKINQATENSVNYYADVQARNICNSTMESVLSMLFDDSTNYRTSSPITKQFFNGTASYTVTDELFDGDSLIKITVNANFNGVSRQAVSYTGALGGWVPPYIRGAWTANGNLNKTISDMFLDGRDHSITPPYNIVPGTGVAGVSTSVPFVNTQFAAIGGTSGGIDYPMTFPENPAVIENFSWGGNFPQSPDQILGYPQGTLKSIAMSGRDGSQYITVSTLKKIKWPLKGVTYVDLPTNKSIGFELATPPVGQVNQGILAIHAPGVSSEVNGLKAANKTDPPFVGLIITDYSFHHHLNVLGAIMQLSPNLELSSNCNGNKDHWVYYSSQAIINATQIAAQNTSARGNNNSDGMNGSVAGALGGRRYSALAWYE